MDNETRCAGDVDRESVAERFARLWAIEDVCWFLGGVTPEFVRKNLPKADPGFPAPFKLGTKLDRWHPAELVAWRDGRLGQPTEDTDRDVPAELDASPGATALRHQKVARPRKVA